MTSSQVKLEKGSEQMDDENQTENLQTPVGLENDH